METIEEISIQKVKDDSKRGRTCLNEYKDSNFNWAKGTGVMKLAEKSSNKDKMVQKEEKVQ